MENSINNRKSNKFVKITLNVLFYLFIFSLLLFSIINLNTKKEDDIPALFNRGFVTVLSDSMNGDNKDHQVKSFKKGSLILVKTLTKEEKLNLKVGDVVVFWGQLDSTDPKSKAFIIHRIISIDKNIITTQGDNVTNKNIRETNHIDSVKAIATSKIENIGKPLNYLQTPNGFAIFVLVPLLILVIWQVVVLLKFIVTKNKASLELQYALDKERLKEELLKELEDNQKR